MGKRPSVKRQVQQAIDSINRIGHSKHQDRLEGKEIGLYSYSYTNSVLKSSIEFAKWVKSEFGVKYLKDINQEHYKAFLDFKEVEVSVGHLKNIESHLRKLQIGVAKKFKTRESFVTEKRYIHGDRNAVRNRSITLQQYEHVRMNVSKDVCDVVDLQYNLGLRVKEACNIRVEHVVFEEGRMLIKIEDGKGITKGGRFREIPVPIRFENQLKSMLGNKDLGDRLCNSKPANVRAAIFRFNKKFQDNVDGSHAFRHSYARNRFKEEIGSEEYETAMSYLKQRLDGTYEMKKDNRFELRVDSVVNAIHSELGHGKSRWDLVKVYLQ